MEVNDLGKAEYRAECEENKASDKDFENVDRY
jgi:hypothetical protein